MGYIPLHLDSGCTSRIPKWPKARAPSSSTLRRGYTEEWWTFCKASAVGEYETGKSFGAYGSRRNKTVARDCQKEIEAGKQPNIPFSKDVVYVPFPVRVQWPHQVAPGGLDEISEEKESSSEGQALVETSGNDRPKARVPRVIRELTVAKENVVPTKEADAAIGIMDKQPTRLRAARKIQNPVTAATATAPAPLRLPRESRPTTRARAAKEVSRETTNGLPDLPPLRVLKSSSRAAERCEPTPPSSQSSQSSQTDNPPTSTQCTQLPTVTRSAPRFRTIGSEMPSTDSLAVLARLHTFRDNLARALEKKPSRSRYVEPPQLPFVAKWVDYSRRYGVGYVLDDGSIGTLLSESELYPVTAAIAADGYNHLRKTGQNRELAKSVPLDYYMAIKQDRGISQIEVQDRRRIEEIRTVWHKFGKYMCATFGDEELPPKEGPQRTDFVKFYQRLGNIGIWGFQDGSFQVCGLGVFTGFRLTRV
jgi:myosin-1